MQISTCDAKGRLYLRGSLRSLYGERFVVLQAPDELVLIPVAADPIVELESLGSKLRGLTIDELKSAIRKQAEEEVIV